MSQSHYDCPCMEKCPLHYAMSVIGGKWKVQIVCALTSAGQLRYNALRGKLDGISNTVLATALRDNIQQRQWMCGFPDKVVVAVKGEYVVSVFGKNDPVDAFASRLSGIYGAQLVYDEAIQ